MNPDLECSEDEAARLVEGLRAGDTTALEELYERYAKVALRFALALSDNRAEAERAVRAGFLAIWHARDAWQPPVQDLPAEVIGAVRAQIPFATPPRGQG